jgi:hypothetical protein
MKRHSLLVRADGEWRQSGDLYVMGESMYPHTCPDCTAAAYIGGDQLVRCTNTDCTHADKDLDVGKLEDDYTFIWEDEDTEPGLFPRVVFSE